MSPIPDDYVLQLVVFSPDGRNAAYIAQPPGKEQVVVVGGKQVGAHEKARDFVFSPDSRNFAYIARINGRESLVLNGRKAEKSYDTVDNPVFSPDSSIVAYEASEKGKFFVVFGDHESGRYDMSTMPPLFSGDGKHVLYILQDYAASKAIAFISEALSGREIRRMEYRAIGPVVLSADGRRFAFPAMKQGSFHLVRGEFPAGEVKEGPALDLLDKLALSPDGLAAAYLAEQRGKRMLVLPGKTIDFSDGELGYPPVFSRDGTKVAWAAEEDGNRRIFVDATAGPAYKEVSAPVFSPDGSMVAYSARKKDKYFIVVGGREGPEFDMVIPPVFSPDGTRLAYRVRDNNKRFIVLADSFAKTIKKFPAYEAVWQPVFSEDGNYLAYGVGTLPVKELWWKVERVE